MDRASLADLRLRWHDAVVFGTTLSPDEFAQLDSVPRPQCWFGENVPGIDRCEEGPRGIEGAHWIKRQRVEAWVKDIARYARLDPGQGVVGFLDWSLASDGLHHLAAWDPRNGVPACEKHHRRFDGHRVDATNELVVWRHEVPAHVEAFAKDWDLETALEDRNPSIGTEC